MNGPETAQLEHTKCTQCANIPTYVVLPIMHNRHCHADYKTILLHDLEELSSYVLFWYTPSREVRHAKCRVATTIACLR
jgi:hypothetical protein